MLVETPSGNWRGRGLEEHAGRGVSAQVGMGGGLFTTINIIYEINQEGSMRSGIPEYQAGCRLVGPP